MYKEVLAEKGIEQTPELTLRILTYEVGNLHKLSVYKERFGSSGYLGEERIELGDVILMAKLLAEQKGYDLQELERDACDRFCHRIDEVARSAKELKK